MRPLFLLAATTLLSAYCYSQTTAGPTLVKAEIGLHGIGVAFEPALADAFTIELAGGLGGNYQISQDGATRNFFYGASSDFDGPGIFATVTPKYFYNLQKRAAQGKNTRLNSANYIGARVKYSTSPYVPTNANLSTLLANVHWGLQRAVGRQWLYNMHAGIGYGSNITTNVSTIYPALEFKFSYVIWNSHRNR